MNTKNIKLVLVSMLFLLTTNIIAQETVRVPLTNPGKPGVLKMGIINGSITVKGTSSKEVIIKGTKKEGDIRHGSRHKRKSSKKGLKRISNTSLEFSAEEFDNIVRVNSSPQGTTDFEIQVPRNFSLKISTINRGFILVENVNGSMDISNVNGKITLKDVSGSVSADALNKDIVVNFLKVTPNTAMAFSSLNGDIDITFPKKIKADIKVKSDRGEIYTDFDLKAKPSKAKVTKGNSKRGNAYRVKVEKWIKGSINGGGPEFLFKNFNGDVIIRAN
ncbi:hypothetical protein DS884_17995 [Tenacibaculum sp. E3R01]|uniref:DUF4097 family beta strand repeat-containing protein n=1 Tax=Tenacibaculum sp. E3R01 TaxID=2267227 RepID=UPI000DEBD62C|nr:DUF4097 family beta strand repeat-containing protein [Tenacibaculum sp. E3R01]RBW54337.1 hypothetical protein DS884_17995 [Tenacibaculum sp. E3R01]